MSDQTGAFVLADVGAVEALLLGLAEIPGECDGLTELDHALQCAQALRKMAPDDQQLQVAGLLHDIAHGQCPIGIHHEVGADALRPLFGERVSELVRLHVDAKRYLFATQPHYLERVSPVSLESLRQQGGPMTAEECAAFESHPHWRDALRLRVADEAAKVAGAPVDPLETWLPLVRAAAGAGLAN